MEMKDQAIKKIEAAIHRHTVELKGAFWMGEGPDPSVQAWSLIQAAEIHYDRGNFAAALFDAETAIELMNR